MYFCGMNVTTDEDIERAVATVRNGGIILYPTDTVWGIGCDATRPEAVRRVFEIKRRADSKALILLLGDIRDLPRYVENIPEPALQIIETATKPTTIIYDHGRNIAAETMAEDGSVAVRVTSEPFSRRLCIACRRPLVSTSANVSGKPAPTCFAEIDPEILAAVDYVVESRRNDAPGAKPSSIIKISDDLTFKIIRQ